MIFNSLGSNYDFRFVIKSLLLLPRNKDSQKLESLLAKKYNGEVKLLYKGREAIKLALAISGLPKGSKVGINGFTCFVVNQAITEAGCVPVYLDLGNFDMNFDIENLKKVKDLRALIIQNTFGSPHNMVLLKSYCSKNNVLIIEDLAHSAGSIYPDGKEAGTVGDFTAISFSQDKIIDAVSGGALIVRNKKFVDSLDKVEQVKLPMSNIIRDRLYPLLTYKIRFLYPIGIGKLIHFLAKKLKILSDPMGVPTNIKYHYLTNWHSSMALYSLAHLDSQIKHRKEIASVYISKLKRNILSFGITKNYNLSSNVRFPIFVKNRADLIHFLKKEGVFVSDIWYDAPVAPRKLLAKTGYVSGDCPNAEISAGVVLNLPTHINVDKKDAEKISILINKWLNTKK